MTAEIAGLFKGRRATVEQLAELFKERPIWSTFALKERLTGLENADVDVLVPRIAYVFRNGRDCFSPGTCRPCLAQQVTTADKIASSHP